MLCPVCCLPLKFLLRLDVRVVCAASKGSSKAKAQHLLDQSDECWRLLDQHSVELNRCIFFSSRILWENARTKVMVKLFLSKVKVLHSTLYTAVGPGIPLDGPSTKENMVKLLSMRPSFFVSL